MYAPGHVGAALLLYAPVGVVIANRVDPILSWIGAGVAVAVATLPDVDHSLPVAHRGPTHTVWFVGAVTALAGTIGTFVASLTGFGSELAAVLASATAVSLTSHLLADLITPMGVAPMAPLSTRRHTLALTPAANPYANAVAFAAGLLAIAVDAVVVFSPPS